jgi:octaheme c-type cytochrome (tetrathionate reductase family)
MNKLKKSLPFLFALLSFLGLLLIVWSLNKQKLQERASPWETVVRNRSHLDHSSFFKDPLQSPQEVTKRCLECHKEAGHQLMQTVHWTWKDSKNGLGKSNLLNNFCLGIQGNWNSCTKCHAGYGWSNAQFDFKKLENMDCLVCHERSGQYVKGMAGVPDKKTNLQQVAQTVGFPKRENCSTCHAYGGGGLAVKHGDLDTSLLNPTEALDVHMGRQGFLCIDCHRGKDHVIPGKAYSVSIDSTGGMDCTSCHKDHFHRDQRLNAHLDAVACQSCHIPTFARKQATKTEWDWSKAGDSSRKEDPHHYLKIKGEFAYDSNVVPTYLWFDKTVQRYLKGDKIQPEQVTEINRPRGQIGDAKAKIWPFKIHNASQIYDAVNLYLMQPVTSGEGGFWQKFDWNQALRLAEPITGLKYSGKYGFTKTRMYWPLSHMVVPKEKALSCNDCHGAQQTRMKWRELGYEADPILRGGRRHLLESQAPSGKGQHQ